MIGKDFSHYHVVGKIGQGGMGTVYRARDLTLDREVAIKLLPTTLSSDAEARKRMVSEARLASRLNHPHIATVYEVNETNDVPYIAMELVVGETLREIMNRSAVPADMLLDIALQIADGLGEAHDAGIFHRDVKPGNIMLDARHRVKILDFGLAVLGERQRKDNESDESYITRTTSQITTAGTIPYMAPEQLRGDATDARADIYSFGVVLYEALTGRLPFYGKTAIDTSYAILHNAPPPIYKLLPKLAPNWSRVIQRCLEKSASDRYQSMNHVVTALKSTRGEAPVTIRSAPKRAQRAVAVLYFDNLSRDAEDDYFRDGMTEDIITALSQIKQLKVFPRSSVVAFRDKSMDATQIGRELGASHILGGSLRRAGKRLRISAQLVEVDTGHTEWAERYDRTMEDVFEIQDEIATNIAAALRVVLTDEEKKAIETSPTENIDAYDCYLRGRRYFHQFNRTGYQFAEQMFAKAIQIDPKYALAFAGVADCHSMLYAYWESTPENLRQAEQASAEALELAPNLAEAHVSRGLPLFLASKFDQAEEAFSKAIELNPKLFEAYYFFGRARMAEGKPEEAAKLFAKASELRPDDYQSPGHIAGIYDGLGRRGEARATDRRTVQIAEKHLELQPDDARALYLGAVSLCRLGETERSLEWAERALKMDPHEPVTLYNVACVYALQGRLEEAIDCLNQALDYGFGHKAWIENDSDLDALRSHERFQALLARL